ncbi:hypothetical protein IFM89_024616 [Coptis chinensis]|uniref:Glutathione S-transferase n=1 Tax=Coptis chinensis TaxID=261450 RepID=A0A835I1B9_9MAGN|nr:hypothetical protein IFM89_024616 [Coptis chinensis]
MLRAIEEHGGLGENFFFGGDEIGLVDLVMRFLAQWFGVIEEVVWVKVMEPQEFPCLKTWIKNFKEVPVITENLPDHEEMVPMFKWRRENSSIAELFVTTGENRDKAAKDCLEMLRTIEEHSGLGEKKFFGGDEIGLADLVLGFLAQWFGVIEEVVAVKIMEPQQFPPMTSCHDWRGNKRLFGDAEIVGIEQKKLFGGDEIGLVDLVLGVLAHWNGVIEE